MDEFFIGLESRLRRSVKVADSVMMGLVNAAMEDAYKKSLWKDGDLERLVQKLRFAELAIMQLEWSLRFVRGEMESGSGGGGDGDCHEQLLDDLLETRDRIQARLDEAELAVADKDRDYMLRKHEELASSRREAAVPAVSGRASALRREADDDEKRRVFGELKGSVDRQMARMRFRLEDARSTLMALMETVSGEASPMARLQEAGHEGDGVKCLSGFYSMAQLLMEFQEMVLDAGAVSDSVTSSFEFMERSVSSLKEAMDEQQWLANVEKEMYAATINGFLREISAGFPVLNDCSSPGERQPPTENIWEETEHLKEKTEHNQKSLKGDQCGISGSEYLTTTRPAATGQCYSEEPSICHEEVERLIEEKIDSEIRCELQHVLHSEIFRDLVRKLAVLDVQKLTEENGELNIRVELLCEIYTTVFKDLVSKLSSESAEHFIRTFIKDEVEAVIFARTLKEIKSVTEMVRSEKHIKEENNCSFPGEIEKGLEQNIDFNVLRFPDENACTNNLGRFSMIGNIEQLYTMKMQTSGASEDKCTDYYQVPLEKEILSSPGNCDRQDSEENYLLAEISTGKDGVSDAWNGNVEQSLQQQDHRKLHVGDTALNLSIPPEEANTENAEMTLILNEKLDVIHSTGSNSMLAEQDHFDLQMALVSFTGFQEVFMNFEAVTCEKLETAMLRLNYLKKQQGNLIEQMRSLKMSEQSYQIAFIRRCHDLQTAEAEVDLLGDEVELLLGLLRKTYKALDRYSPVLEHYLGVREMLKLLGKELALRHQV
ncbi:Os04g0521600 [Oryza sativa Japonica Group]|uniref:OSJNBa0019D11.17 protein n=1 Tax=Oryza sativa subsp. japonica TaxID=39947 RepID=Q7XP68_ORYSJ|nr:Os04g0521600 [Oryza sativa Japonica Group]CAE03748.1 OSJNBa0019D11.17 [Oryza sativa Japonica Group]|eukprot:NP_001053337.1 Os04g0521600 [Oryza sativa Japonica Group]